MSEGSRLWQPATIVAVEPEAVVVSFKSLRHCQRCLRGEGCGAGVFGRLFPSRPTTLRLPGQHDFAMGQNVRVGLSPAQLLRASLVLYGLPLAAFMTGVVAGHVAFRQAALVDLLALIAGLIGLAMTLLILPRLRFPVLNPALEPMSCSALDSSLESDAD